MNTNLNYGKDIIDAYNIDKDFEIWENKNNNDYNINIELPEFTCLCPRSGYPDFARVIINYIPNKYIVELKAIKLYINSFRDRKISHENSANEIYDLLKKKLDPKYLNVTMDFAPRGNVHMIVEVDSKKNRER